MLQIGQMLEGQAFPQLGDAQVRQQAIKDIQSRPGFVQFIQMSKRRRQRPVAAWEPWVQPNADSSQFDGFFGATLGHGDH